MHSAVTGAIGALRGPLHGGANEAAMELIEKFRDAGEAVAGVRGMLARKEKVMGFGHAVYKLKDPRNAILKRWSKRLSAGAADAHLYAVSEAIEKLMADEKKLFPNADFYCASAYHFAGIADAAVHAAVRHRPHVSGWCATSRSSGPTTSSSAPRRSTSGPDRREFVPIEKR